MLIDLMSQYNYINVSVKLIEVLGLQTAVYWSELMCVYARVINKKYDETVASNGFFDLDREYMSKRTGLTEPEQLLCDKSLIAIGAMCADQSDKNRISLDLRVMESVMTQDDPKELEKLAKLAKKKRSDAKATKQELIKRNLKSTVVEPDKEVAAAIFDWIDAIYEAGNFLTKPAVEAFVKTIDGFSDRKEVKLKVIELAMIHSYKDAAWAINMYKKDYKSNPTFFGTTATAVGTTAVDTDTAF